MEQSEALRIHDALVREYSETQAALRDARQRLGALEKLIDGYRELFPSLAPQPAADEGLPAPPTQDKQSSEPIPRGQEAVLRVLRDRPTKWWTVGSVHKELEGRGWKPNSDNPENATRAALDRVASAPSANVKKRRSSSGTVVYSYRDPKLLRSQLDEEASE